jgi:hypothetical protein
LNIRRQLDSLRAVEKYSWYPFGKEYPGIYRDDWRKDITEYSIITIVHSFEEKLSKTW